MALFRAKDQKPTVVFSIDEMLAYRDTWTTALEEDLEAKLAAAQTPTTDDGDKGPAKPLSVSENGFKAGSSANLSEAEQLVRLVQATLNKLTSENFETLMPHLLKPSLFEPGVAMKVVERIFDKSLDEPKYAPLYATMCLRLAQYEHNFLEGSKMIRTSIVTKTQEVYEKQNAANAGGDSEEIERLRKRKLANIKFVGHLAQQELLAMKIIGIILDAVAAQNPVKEVDLEVSVALVDLLGKSIEALAGRVDAYFQFIQRLVDKPTDQSGISNRVRFLMMNLIDLRKAKWERAGPAGEPDPVALTSAPKGDSGVAAPADVAASLEGRDYLPPTVPPTSSKAVIKRLTNLTEETATEDLRALSAVLNHNPSVNRAACIAYTVESLCLSTKDEDRESLAQVFASNLIDKLELRAGLVWAVANSVACCISDDSPKFYDRLAPLLTAGLKDRTGFKTMMKEILGGAALAIDAVYVEMEGGIDWDAQYIALWSALFAHASANLDRTRVVPPLSELLSCLAQLQPAGIVARTMTDILTSIPDSKLCTYDDLKHWHDGHTNSAKLEFMCKSMELLVL